jgi:N-acetylneuraminate synthase/N,N'-diacetyllegionaminate synthase
MNGTDTFKNLGAFIIAEAGINHNGSLELAIKLVDAAKDAGADAVKFQTFKAEQMVSTIADKADYQKKFNNTIESQFEMLKKLELSFNDFVIIKKHCDKNNIIFLSTPFDYNSADFLEKLVPLYKIGSGELTNLPFLEYIAKKRKPVILSTGMCTIGEVEEAINTILPILNAHKIISQIQLHPLTLLHCTSNYPVDFSEVNLKAMLTLKEAFKLPVGYSDHTLGIEIPIAAVALGATIIEKHFTLDKKLPGPDHRGSLEPHELREMIDAIRNTEESLGNGIKKPTQTEVEVMKVVRRSLIATRNIEAGEVVRESDIAIKRPGKGISPKYKKTIIGMRIRKSIKKDNQFDWQDFK